MSAAEVSAAEAEERALEEAMLAVRPRRTSGLALVAGLVGLAVVAGAVTLAVGSGQPPAGDAGPGGLMGEAAVQAADAEAKGSSPVSTTAIAGQAEAAGAELEKPAPQVPEAAGPSPALLEVAPEGGSAAQSGPRRSPSASKAPVATVARVAPVRTGQLIVKVIPFANVSANGRLLRQAFGTEKYELRAGVYEVEFSHPRRRLRKTVTIRPGEATRLEFNALEAVDDVP